MMETAAILTDDDDIVCNVCSAEFIDADDLKAHKLQFHQDKPSKNYTKHSCKFCDQSFSSSLNFAIHIRDKHLVEIKCCTYCVRAFKTRKELWEHEGKHYLNDSIYHSCSHCPDKFTDLSKLIKHELAHHEDEPGMMLHAYYAELSAVLCTKADLFMQVFSEDTTFRCVCNFTTDNILRYIKHVQKRKCLCYVCNDCHNVYKTKKKLSRHLTINKDTCKLLGNINVRKCVHCFKVISKKAFKYHSKTCKPAVCKKCNKIFSSIHELTEHQMKEHTSDTIVIRTCRFCFQSFGGLDNYANHVQRKHGHEYMMYKYNCTYCSMIFCHPQRLFAHFLSAHKNIRPFRCNICNADFLLRSKFTYHIKMVHKSVGFIEFAKNMNVHFNETKSTDVIKLTPTESLFTKEEESELKKNGIDLNNIIPTKKVQPKAVKKILKERFSKYKYEDFDSSNDEAISSVQKTYKPIRAYHKKRLICGLCLKKCYTKEFYARHMASHDNGSRKCIKCNRDFRNNTAFAKHLKKYHTLSTSLTQTLRSLIEKRKALPVVVPPRKIKYNCNIKRCIIEPYRHIPAKVTIYESDAYPINKKKEVEDCIRIKIISNKMKKYKQAPKIIMRKCIIEATPQNVALKMPVKIDCTTEYIKPAKVVSLIAHETEPVKLDINCETYNSEIHEDYCSDNDVEGAHFEEYQQVAEEIVQPIRQETIEAPPKQSFPRTRTVFIPNAATQNFGEIKIATMHHEAPFFKIIPISLPKPEDEVETEKVVEEIMFGDKKLIQSNPLAHLIDDKTMGSMRHKYYRYKPRLSNPQLALARALIELESPLKTPIEKLNKDVVKSKKSKKPSQPDKQKRTAPEKMVKKIDRIENVPDAALDLNTEVTIEAIDFDDQLDELVEEDTSEIVSNTVEPVTEKPEIKIDVQKLKNKPQTRSVKKLKRSIASKEVDEIEKQLEKFERGDLEMTIDPTNETVTSEVLDPSPSVNEKATPNLNSNKTVTEQSCDAEKELIAPNTDITDPPISENKDTLTPVEDRKINTRRSTRSAHTAANTFKNDNEAVVKAKIPKFSKRMAVLKKMQQADSTDSGGEVEPGPGIDMPQLD